MAGFLLRASLSSPKAIHYNRKAVRRCHGEETPRQAVIAFGLLRSANAITAPAFIEVQSSKAMPLWAALLSALRILSLRRNSCRRLL